MGQDQIVVKGAREHNLRGVDLEIPRGQLVVLTGVSGSGKSSLAFDTLYAEGRRRYVESLSSYARQFLGQLSRPQVDFIGGLSPAVAIEQKTTSTNPRSTVGTVTDIYDYLRLLFGRLGTQYCHKCGRRVGAMTAEQMVNHVLTLPGGTRFMILAPLSLERKSAADVIAQVRAAGFARVRVDGTITDLDQPLRLGAAVQSIEVVVDRLVMLDPDASASPAAPSVDPRLASTAQLNAAGAWPAFITRLTDSVEQALRLSEGFVRISVMPASPASDPAEPSGGEAAPPEEWLLSERNSCTYDGLAFPLLSPQLFSFNHPQGACPACSGLGTRLEVDPELIVPNPALSLHEGAVPYWGELRKKRDSDEYHWAAGLAAQYGFDLDTPWEQLPASAHAVIIDGSGKERVSVAWVNAAAGTRGILQRTWLGLAAEIKRKYQQTTSDAFREFYGAFMSEQSCALCHGTRLRPESGAVIVGGRSMAEMVALPLADVQAWVERLAAPMPERKESPDESQLDEFASREVWLSPTQQEIAADVLRETRARLSFLVDVGLHYLTLNRRAPTLSGGEAQRIRLASQIGSGLVGVMYILDEPSIGLHQRDNRKLIDTLIKLRDLGNTVLVVEHDEETMLTADWIIDFGPGAGVRGGYVVAQGTPEQVTRAPESLTGAYLAGRLSIPVPAQRRSGTGAALRVVGATLHNLRDVTATFPLGTFICVTGVSGSGKSSLAIDTLYPALANRLNKAQLKVGPHQAIEGLEHLDKVIAIDQQPIGRSPRSNPATFVKLFDDLRALFAQTSEAKLRGYDAARFSFNLKGGRCEACEGNGEQHIDMQFLADVSVRCEVCDGSRYNRETLQVTYRGKNIAEVLAMDVQTALEFFANVPRIARLLQTLHDVGLDYLALGQASTTLSGGEAQRVKLAKELARVATGRTVYLLDEPTTGLHYADVQRVLEVLHQLVEVGNTVIVIEHHLDVIKTADWVIDMGPDGGSAGGLILAQGTPEAIAQVDSSHTGRFLRPLLGVQHA